jgi:sarcosine oxidase
MVANADADVWLRSALMERVDHVVIGAGAMGSAAAWQLARRGRSVVLLEQFEPGHTRGSSHGGTRIFRLAYADPRYAQLARRALDDWRDLEDDAGATLLDLVGAFDHGDPSRIDAVEGALRALGRPFERLSPAEASERCPGMRFDRAVVHSPDGGRARAAETLRCLADRARAHGATVRFGTGPARLELDDDGATVRCGGEAWSAATVVVTAGAWAQPVAGHLVELPQLTVTQEQIAHFSPLDPATDDWPSFIHHPAQGGGSFDHYGLWTPGEGVKVGGHLEGPVTTADDRDGVQDPARVARLVDYVSEWLPGVEPAPRFGATCLYTTTATEDFLVDRVGPVVVGSPCSGHGFKFTPLIGRVLADLATGADHPGPPFLRLS